MICVTIASPSHHQMASEHQDLAKKGARLVELRLDHLQAEPKIDLLLKDRPTPVIVTCRLAEDGGVWYLTEERRRHFLVKAMEAGADYVDLEDGIAAILPRTGTAKRIVSWHNFVETPEDLDAVYDRLAAQDADVVKIACFAQTPLDSLRMLDLVKRKRDAKIPLVGFCMGEYGVPSRILCQAFGSPFTYCQPTAEQALAPGMMAWEVMRDLYRAEELTPEVEVFGVIADPVGHSMSPVIHNSAFIKNQLPNRVYIPLRVQPEFLGEFMRKAPEVLNLKGLSVTIPHKEKVIPLLDQVDTSVKVIGACNTVLWNADGSTLGTNTDYQAAMSSLASAASTVEGSAKPLNWSEPLDDPQTGVIRETPLTGKTALIMGAGGVGKALAIGLARRGASLVLTDADFPRAKALAERLTADGYTAEACEWDFRHEIDVEYLVNCTPIGMFPNVGNSPYDVDRLKEKHVCFDAVYNPEETLFIRSARQNGCAVVNGLRMFVLQAGMQFERFTGTEPPLDLMREVVQNALNN